MGNNEELRRLFHRADPDRDPDTGIKDLLNLNKGTKGFTERRVSNKPLTSEAEAQDLRPPSVIIIRDLKNSGLVSGMKVRVTFKDPDKRSDIPKDEGSYDWRMGQIEFSGTTPLLRLDQRDVYESKKNVREFKLVKLDVGDEVQPLLSGKITDEEKRRIIDQG